ncbi:MAG: HAD-superfamily subfamily hydrolase [Candidatus Saccharibacteria bacterium]|nr:HAD-superfamily subfamily hydrolase [Candidatus Saccharibacteria bacterium]
MSKKFAVFDIDGTIFHWQFFHELFDELVEAGVIDASIAHPVLEDRKKWRQGSLDWSVYETGLVKALNVGIVGIDKQLLEEISDRIITVKGKVLYHYTRDLLRELQSQGYTTIVISGSQQTLVERFARTYKIDIALGLDYEFSDDKLVAIKREIYGQKDTLLKQVVAEHGLDWHDSYAVGDTSGDAGMLELVDNPIAFNPDSKLLAIAKEKGWKIVVERKSMAYTLEKNSDGLYVLS